jgi:hypothetical protein
MLLQTGAAAAFWSSVTPCTTTGRILASSMDADSDVLR